MSNETSPYCQEDGGKIIRQCAEHDCLPHNNYNWQNNQTGERNHYRVWGWRNHPKNSDQSDMQYVGGCINFKKDSFLTISLDSTDYRYANKNGLKNRGAFAECMRICAIEYKGRCLSVTFFPSFPPWASFEDNGNCYLHEMRCHEQENFRDMKTINAIKRSSESDKKIRSISWYAYKDICNAPRVCSRLGLYDLATCDSSGKNAFPNQPKCSCSSGQDKNSGHRRFGNPLGLRFYDRETGLYKVRTSYKTGANAMVQKATWYNEYHFSRKVKTASIRNYEKYYQGDTMACHGMYLVKLVNSGSAEHY